MIPTYRLCAEHLEVLWAWVQRVPSSTNGIYGLLRNLIFNMLSDCLESCNWSEEVPGLDKFLVFSVLAVTETSYFEKDCAALHLIERLIAVPRCRKSASEFRHDGDD